MTKVRTEAIYPLPRYEETDINEQGETEVIERSVDERLTHIYRALAEMPNEVERQYKCGSQTLRRGWGEGWSFWTHQYKWADNGMGLPRDHRDCDHFRLAISEAKTVGSR